MPRIVLFICLLLVGNIAFSADNSESLCAQMGKMAATIAVAKNNGIDSDILINVLEVERVA